uniref:RNA helicase n=1 Tax=Euglena gracilis TaxID=3039 RepID=A0AA51UB20_EUGGR|nr:putative ATP-dependent RNA helicase DDX5/DDX17 [Euglena gracilis]BDX17143.1 probable ATP-dependent RNA helicase DDX5/DDX17 F [Euglena gracilis]
MPAPRDALLGQLADKRKAVARRKPKGLISRDGKGRVVAKVEVNGQKSKRGGYMEIKHFHDKKNALRPFRREFRSHVRTDEAAAETLRRTLHVTVTASPSGNAVPAPLTSWDQLTLPKAIRQQLLSAGFVVPTPIQAQLIPALLSGNNCLGIAQTGSGKTLAYLLPLVIHVLAHPCETSRNPLGLVLAPTRELALQIDQVLRPLVKCVGLSSARVIGGMDRRTMETAVALGVHICVATPNCFFDTAVVDSITLSCHRITMVVLDEVDRMLAMGFEEQVRAILGCIRPDRHVAVLSATCSAPVQRLLQSLVKDCTRVAVNEVHGLTMNASIKQHFYCMSEGSMRVPKLLQILQGRSPGTVIAFVATQRCAAKLSDALNRKGIPAVPLHGKLPQRDRLAAMSLFDEGHATVLVATELAARGLDLRKVRCVVNYAMPSKARDYVHRIGRTGRAGDEGESHSFVLPSDAPVCRGICAALRQAGLPVPSELREHAKRAAAEAADQKALMPPRKRKPRPTPEQAERGPWEDGEEDDAEDGMGDAATEDLMEGPSSPKAEGGQG